jgi:hypothetical protein
MSVHNQWRLTGVLILLQAAFATSLLAAPASGLGVSLPLIGRLGGAGGVLYKTAVDITNSRAVPTQVDFYIDGADRVTGQTISLSGSLTADGFGGQGSAVLPGRTSVHFADIVRTLADQHLIPADMVDHGFLGSMMLVFDGATRSGEGAATARFYNGMGAGTVGVALKGHEMTGNEPLALTATIQDSRGNADGAPELYTNIFLNNTGLTSAGAPTADPVSIEVIAYSARTGQRIGSPVRLTVGPGQTAGVPTGPLGLGKAEPRAVIVARVTSGTASIQGLVSLVDNVTKDGSAYEMGAASIDP